MSVGLCPSCGSGIKPGASFCWLCGYPLGEAAGGAPPVARATTSPPIDGYLWIVGFVLALLVIIAVAVELAVLWPGLLIPYAVVLVPVLVVLVRLLYVQRFDFWRANPPASGSGPGTASRGGTAASAGKRGDEGSGSEVVGEVARAVAIGMAGALAAVAVLGLLALAAFVILISICLGLIVISGGVG